MMDRKQAHRVKRPRQGRRTNIDLVEKRTMLMQDIQ
jgi:hypothetical protein